MRIIIVSLVIATLSAGPAAFADDAVEAALVAFQEGTDLFEAGEYSQAAVAFRKAYKSKPTWKILYNIGQCEAASGQYGRALEDFETFLALGADEVDQKRREEVESELDRLRKLVGLVEIDAPEGATVFLNDEERGTAPLPGKLMVTASIVHKLRVEREGQPLLERDIQVGGTQTISIEVNEDDPDTAKTETAPSPELAPASKRNPLKVTGIVMAGVGGAAAIAGLVTGKLSLTKTEELEEKCGGATSCENSNKGLHDEAETLAKTTNVLLIAGAGLVVTGVVLAIIGHKKSKSNKKMAIQTTPLVGQTLVGIGIQGSF